MSKNKKKRKATKYNQIQFVNVVCIACGMCDPGTKPSFCFNAQYKKNPKRFMEKCYPKLHQLDAYTQQALLSETKPSAFQRLFCKSNMCGQNYSGDRSSCGQLFRCMSSFADQLQLRSYTTVKRRKKKDKKKYVCQPYPTFFSNDPKAWQEKIRSVLTYENDDIESNKTKTDAGSTEGAVDS